MADVEGGIQNLEFKSPEDDSWYQVSIQYGYRDGSCGEIVLVIGYPDGHQEFPPYFDVHYESGHRRGQVYSVNLHDSKQVEETIARFRCKSTQLQDSQHWELQGDSTICAAYRSNNNNDAHYFNAMIKEVAREAQLTSMEKISTTTSSADTITVSAKVLWNDGPSKGEITTVPASDIRLLSPGGIEAHPVIQFLQEALQRNAAPFDLPDLNVPVI